MMWFVICWFFITDLDQLAINFYLFLLLILTSWLYIQHVQQQQHPQLLLGTPYLTMKKKRRKKGLVIGYVMTRSHRVIQKYLLRYYKFTISIFMFVFLTLLILILIDLFYESMDLQLLYFLLKLCGFYLFLQTVCQSLMFPMELVCFLW